MISSDFSGSHEEKNRNVFMRLYCGEYRSSPSVGFISGTGCGDDSGYLGPLSNSSSAVGIVSLIGTGISCVYGVGTLSGCGSGAANRVGFGTGDGEGHGYISSSPFVWKCVSGYGHKLASN